MRRVAHRSLAHNPRRRQQAALRSRNIAVTCFPSSIHSRRSPTGFRSRLPSGLTCRTQCPFRGDPPIISRRPGWHDGPHETIPCALRIRVARKIRGDIWFRVSCDPEFQYQALLAAWEQVVECQKSVECCRRRGRRMWRSGCQAVDKAGRWRVSISASEVEENEYWDVILRYLLGEVKKTYLAHGDLEMLRGNLAGSREAILTRQQS